MLLKEPRLAIIGAMDEEIQALLDLMETIETQDIKTVRFYLGTLNSKPVVLFKSGIGLTMAAMSASLCFSHFNVLGVINIGTAGGLSDDLSVLDVVVAEKITYHDIDISAFGVPRSFDSSNRYVFYSDPDYLKSFESMNHTHRLFIGPVVSGHQFISQKKQIDEITQFYPEAIAVEMEGAAIAHVAGEFKLPFIIIRSISDLVHAPKNEMSFDEYLNFASQRSAQACFDFMGKID